MRKTIMAGLLAATLAPVAAQAQISPSDRRELQRDRQDIRDEQRDLNRAYRYGDKRDVRKEQRDVRDAKREYREDYREARRDWGRDDWRSYRGQNRNLYRGGNWRSDYRYQQFGVGSRLGAGYYSQRYWISDPGRYRLPPTGFGQRWVRFYNDVLLVDTRSGRVIDVIRGFYW